MTYWEMPFITKFMYSLVYLIPAFYSIYFIYQYEKEEYENDNNTFG